jgi:hypothetical protein
MTRSSLDTSLSTADINAPRAFFSSLASIGIVSFEEQGESLSDGAVPLYANLLMPNTSSLTTCIRSFLFSALHRSSKNFLISSERLVFPLQGNPVMIMSGMVCNRSGGFEGRSFRIFSLHGEINHNAEFQPVHSIIVDGSKHL